MTLLDQSFYVQPTLQVAQQLLGKYLVYKDCEGIIVETEAYHQMGDEACHASRGMTRRNQSMFLEGGHLYVYRIHQVFCLNVVTEEEGLGSAVLIRAVKPVKGLDLMKVRRSYKTALADGPGKLCQAFNINLRHDGLNLYKNPELYIEDRGVNIDQNNIHQTSRIGISKSTELLWRFLVSDQFV